jgi:hypothetical protein
LLLFSLTNFPGCVLTFTTYTLSLCFRYLSLLSTRLWTSVNFFLFYLYKIVSLCVWLCMRGDKEKLANTASYILSSAAGHNMQGNCCYISYWAYIGSTSRFTASGPYQFLSLCKCYLLEDNKHYIGYRFEATGALSVLPLCCSEGPHSLCST